MATNRKRTSGTRPPNPYDVAARVGNDHPGLEADGIAVGTIAGVAGMALPERVRRNASPEQLRALGVAFTLCRSHAAILEQLDHAVSELRRLGLSWDTIGWVTGLSAAGARKRWGTS